MRKFKWVSNTITNADEANTMIRLWDKIKPRVAAFDTETTGLNIVLDKPFLFQWGFVDESTETGYTFAVDLEAHPKLGRKVIKAWNKLASRTPIYTGANVKFDLHMLHNIGLPYEVENLTDIQFYIRLGHDAVATKNGGPPLALKNYAAMYIERNAKFHEKKLEEERALIAKQYNIKLMQRLNAADPTGRWTLKRLTDFFKDCIAEYTDLPTPELVSAYEAWLDLDLPKYLREITESIIDKDMIRYNTLTRENVLTYSHLDIVYTLEIFYLLEPVVEARGNNIGIVYENKCILPLIDMERCGFCIDKPYLLQAQKDLKQYIKQRRLDLLELTNKEFKVGQHAVIKTILKEMTGQDIPSSDKGSMAKLKAELERSNPTNKAIETIATINELRTLEKWYSTYIKRFVKQLNHTDRLYTQIQQVGTVSGRVTSDFQQFPKKGIVSKDGVPLFNPRKMIKISGGDYDGLVYLDYSQIELRFQALYTILVGHPDLNLCRAYMPYKCINNKGELFDYNNIEHIRHWRDEWYYEEEPKKHWVATDVHGATTEKAFDITPDDPRFHDLRYVGKRVNFAKNYGAQFNKIWQMFPEYDEEQVHKIDDAYYAAFPGVKEYHQYCYQLADAKPYATNLFGVRYYGVSGHKLINMLVQGSAAYYLKTKIRQIWEYSKANNVKSRLQMQIHDELSWEKHKDEAEVFSIFQSIMEDWEDTLVPIVADMELSTSTWSAKEEVDKII